MAGTSGVITGIKSALPQARSLHSRHPRCAPGSAIRPTLQSGYANLTLLGLLPALLVGNRRLDMERRLLNRDTANACTVRIAHTLYTNFHAVLHKTFVGCINAYDGNTRVKNEFRLSALELDLDVVAAIDDRRANHCCVGHCPVLPIAHWPLAFAHTPHDIREDAQFS